MLPGFRAMARYNRWMNERIYGHCENLSDAERRADRGAFFRSIHGTLNHLLLGDRRRASGNEPESIPQPRVGIGASLLQNALSNKPRGLNERHVVHQVQRL